MVPVAIATVVSSVAAIVVVVEVRSKSEMNQGVNEPHIHSLIESLRLRYRVSQSTMNLRVNDCSASGRDLLS